MTSVADADSTACSNAFTVLIPRGLRGSVEGLPPQTRQALYSELFRMASRAHPEEGPPSLPRMACLELEGCHATVEVDTSRSRLTLAGLTRIRVLG
ncbi:hypothetical protein [Myxococcus landrumensis]|uniref:Uncharacterized protein n=1 Tax=Myxococcus landrumensis TaxID=2813577 RepID=A0ABX7N3G4_9BACT|nr:hypothetical protein [Myxococcus landrumus]QSQ11941.1 hypothetical protein JY572_26580 [Myxococcus landrumus]